MSEEEIIKTVDNFLDGYRQYNVKTGETYIPYKHGEGQKFCYVEDFEAIQGLLDLYNKEKEKNKELEHRLKNHVVTKYQIRKIKEEKIQEFRNAPYDNTPNSRFKIFGEISILNILLKLKNEE